MANHIRTAFFEGAVAANNRDQFETIINDELVPSMKKFPNILRVEAFWATDIEDPEREIMLCLQHEYAEHSHIQQAITSDVRLEIQPIIESLKKLFNGHIYHVNYTR